ncbi:MAG TPA: hypothetical protein VGR90_06210, partial [Acidimicrobiales bacterium]|nr:hypothetical protein [Acidimicrobiales bacterium]
MLVWRLARASLRSWEPAGAELGAEGAARTRGEFGAEMGRLVERTEPAVPAGPRSRSAMIPMASGASHAIDAVRIETLGEFDDR